MSLTLKQSAEAHKKSVLERSKYTDSPLKDKDVKEQSEKIIEKKLGKKKADDIAINENKEQDNTQAKEIMDSVPEVEDDFIKIEDLVSITKHLPKFSLMNSVIALQGEIYQSSKKEAYKQLVSLAIPSDKMIIQIGAIKTDTRRHNVFVIPSGKGKKEINTGIKRTFELFNPNADIKQTTKPHKEHLIGKVLRRKDKVNGKPQEKIIKKLGFLAADLLIIEESHEILDSSDKNEVDIRDLLTIATDVYGDLPIQKLAIDDLDEEAERISYYPHVSLLAFLQPLAIREEFATKGLQRRVNITYREFPKKTESINFINRLNDNNNNDKSCVEFSKYMKKISNVGGVWKLESDAIDEFVKLHLVLLEQGFLQGGKSAAFTKIMEYPMQNKLIQEAAIIAISNLRSNITKDDIQFAFLDIMERYTWELMFVEKLIKGSLDYGSSWGGATGKIQECLEWLYHRGATSKEESDIRVGSFQKLMGKILDKSERRARDDYTRLKSDGLISDWKGAKGESLVWLNFTPDINGKKKADLINPKTEYLKVFEELELAKTDENDKNPQRSQRTQRSLRTLKTQTVKKSKRDSSSLKASSSDSTPLSVRSVLPVRSVRSKKTDSTRDLSYNEDPVCNNIIDCKPDEVLAYVKKHPKHKISELVKMFGPGVMKLKAEGLIQ